MNWKRSDTRADRKGLRCSGERFEGDDIIEADLDILATHRERR
jgi:hypothetical protein